MGIVATLYPVTDSHNTLCIEAVSGTSTDGYGGYSLSVTDSHNTLCDRSCAVPIPMRIVATLPVTDSYNTLCDTATRTTRSCVGSSYRWVWWRHSLSVTDSHNTLCDKAVSRSCVSSSYRCIIVAALYPVTDSHNTLWDRSCVSSSSYLIIRYRAITHFATVVSVPCRTLYPLPTAITHFATKLCRYLYRWVWWLLFNHVTDVRSNTLCDEAVSVPRRRWYGNTLYPLPTAITHFATRSCRYLIPMGIVAILYPLQTAITRYTDPGCVGTHRLPMGIVATLYPITDSRNTLCDRSCCQFLIPMGIVATLYPVADSHNLHFAARLCRYLAYRWVCNTLCDRAVSVPHTDGYGNTLYPVTDEAITHFATEAVSVPHTDGYGGYLFIPLPTTAALLCDNCVSTLIPMGMVATLYPLPTAITFATKLSVPHTDGIVATLYPLPTAHLTRATEAVSVPHTDGIVATLCPLPTAITPLRQRSCVGTHSRWVWWPLFPVTNSRNTLCDRSCVVHLILMGIVATLCPLPTAATHFATEAVSVPHTDGYGGYSLSVTDGHNTLCDRSCVSTSYRWV
ncbi:unnamed protein product [Acanthosepion pharaonis]|uniref:Uncharacterized protein n=1 Tax=Acanthosepion pharaonis TaxID=158019 RepID=A0A812CW84_ACAPH|nr:unnamed protein product [Sepia pharaonis]